jgi:hypothetical protein
MRTSFVQLLREICDECHLDMVTFSKDWIINVSDSSGKQVFIYGYNFDINGSASQQVCSLQVVLC